MALHPLPTIAALTRRVQALRPQQPLRGLTRLGNTLDRTLPPYSGVITLPAGIRMHLNSQAPAERALMLYGDYHHALTDLLRRHTAPGAHCLDIGANLGFYTLMLAQWAGSGGRVAAFEANPALVEKLQGQLDLNGFAHVEIVPQAVDQQAGKLNFYVADAAGKSSIYADHVRQPQSILTVTATTLDDYVSGAGWSRLDVIKSDIEGNDCRGLLGGASVIERFRPFIIFEYWRSTPSEVAYATVTMLQNAGYRLEVMLHSGARLPFNGTVPNGYKHVDVLCIPT